MLRFLLLMLLPSYIFAQKNFSVKIQFPANVKTEYLKFDYDDGKDRHVKLQPIFKNNETTIEGTYYSKYATLDIEYSEGVNGSYNIFWVDDKPANIRFLTNSDSTGGPLKMHEAENAYPLNTMGKEKLDAFTANESNDFFDFISKHRSEMNDSLARLAIQKSQMTCKKNIEFVKMNPNLYYSFWFFRYSIITYFHENPDSLMVLYENTFSDSLKNTFEGKQIVQYLKGRQLSTEDDYIDFTTKDSKNQPLTLSNIKSHYVLLDFWASWCGPCLKKQPYIKKIRKKYSIKDVEIIDISHDEDILSFKNAVKKYDLNWTHILFNDSKEIINSYGVNGIPVMFLIDTSTKKIIYADRNSIDEDLSILNQLLSEKLSKIP